MDESDQTLSPARYDDEIDLRELARVIWAGKWLIGGITIAAIVVALIIALMLPNIYRAEALLAPNEPDSASGLGALAAQYGGLASLAGVDLGGQSTDRSALAMEVLKSRKFIREFIARHNILVPLMAADGWNASTGELSIDSGLYNEGTGEWVRNVSAPRMAVPSSQEAHHEFSKLLSVTKDRQTGFVTLAVEHYSPHIAKQWVDWLIDDVNATLMAQEVGEAQQAIEYLSEQITATSVVELQSVFYHLIEEHTKTVLLAEVRPEYMFRTVDPAVAPEERTNPRRALIVFLGLIIGIVVGAIVVLITLAVDPNRS